ncbi:MAG: PulJ/GspJ family protein [Solirubrobacteraceae bacterium]
MRRDQRQAGYTLIEMLVAMALALVVIGGPLTFLIVSFNQSNSASSRAVASRQAELVLERLTRELRQAQNIASSTDGSDTTPVTVSYGGGTSSVSFYLPAAGSSVAGGFVTWTCTANSTCTRTCTPAANCQSTATSLQEARNVTSAAFTPKASDGSTLSSPATNPAYVSLNLQVRVTSQADSNQTATVKGVTNSISVQDGVAPRRYGS